MMNTLLVILFAVFFPFSYVISSWVFGFAEISPHISLIYLPAFMRLANVLILGSFNGFLATLLGSLLLMAYLQVPAWAAVLNSLCSAGGPLVALWLFRWHSKRSVELTSLKDLTLFTLLYAVSNAVLHHLTWSLVDRSKLQAPSQVLWMILGDITGPLLGAYALKWVVVKYRACKFKAELLQ
jgi:uncharacterized membrane protein